MTEQELNFYKKQEEEAKNKLWKIACEYGAEAHGRKPYILWEDVQKVINDNTYLFEQWDDDEEYGPGISFNTSSLLIQELEGKVWVENYGQQDKGDKT